MEKIKELYNNLSIENKARAEGALAVVIIYIVFNVISYSL